MNTAYNEITEDGTYLLSRDGHLYPVELNHGYTVGIQAADTNTVPPSDKFVGRWTDRFQVEFSYGTEEREEVYWDRVEVIESLLEAGNVARLRGELAIWDNLNDCEIRV